MLPPIFVMPDDNAKNSSRRRGKARQKYCYVSQGNLLMVEVVYISILMSH